MLIIALHLIFFTHVKGIKYSYFTFNYKFMKMGCYKISEDRVRVTSVWKGLRGLIKG